MRLGRSVASSRGGRGGDDGEPIDEAGDLGLRTPRCGGDDGRVTGTSSSSGGRAMSLARPSSRQ